MLYPLKMGLVRVRGRVRVTMSMETINIFLSQDYSIPNNCRNKLVKIPTDTGELIIEMPLWISESMGGLGLGLQDVSQ